MTRLLTKLLRQFKPAAPETDETHLSPEERQARERVRKAMKAAEQINRA